MNINKVYQQCSWYINKSYMCFLELKITLVCVIIFTIFYSHFNFIIFILQLKWIVFVVWDDIATFATWLRYSANWRQQTHKGTVKKYSEIKDLSAFLNKFLLQFIIQIYIFMNYFQELLFIAYCISKKKLWT